ncbi:sensor histidine kinase [Psychromicrobium xiongbiense]|uniref:sensor histidine kinase n=1 Tax=Psychromicrobium xiongbiense TaxID=3051184 RepID=UPI0025551D6D|nr:HAMP domain-containing sensor histidine kinase [Psychromicrobium sp. YIM S02556]
MFRLWHRASLRTQLVAVISALLVLALVFFGAVANSLMRQFLVDQMDSQLRIVQSSILGSGFTPSSVGSQVGGLYAKVVSSDGSVSRESSNPGTQKPVFAELTLDQAVAHNGVPFDLKDQSGPGTWRALIVAPVPLSGLNPTAPPLTGYMLIAITYDEFDKSATRLLTAMIAAGVLIVIVGTLTAFLIVSRAFVPLRRVERTAAMIAAGDLSQRVDVANPATEVGRLSESLNTMLARIESAFEVRKASEESMRRFIADASHELRTPLVTIRGFSELYRQGALVEQEQVGTAMARIEGEAQRMGALVGDLLVLARIDEQRPLARGPVDLLVLGHDAVVDARARAPRRRIAVVGLDGGPAPQLRTVADESRIRQVLTNLMGNALRYTPEDSPLELVLGVREEDGLRQVVLQVRDHGAGISEEEAAKIFDRFYRAESSRSRDTGGSGLGLAIVAGIVASHGGSVRVSATPGGGATFTVLLPLEAPGDAEAGSAVDGIEEIGG